MKYDYNKMLEPNKNVLTCIKIEVGFGMMLRMMTNAKGIELSQSGPFTFATIPAHSDELNRLINNVWKTLLPVYLNDNNRNMISLMLEDNKEFYKKMSGDIELIKLMQGDTIYDDVKTEIGRYYGDNV